jgi:hypothetical protein
MKVVQLFEPYNFHVDHFSKFQIDFELEQIRISKITFDFPKQLEKLPT